MTIACRMLLTNPNPNDTTKMSDKYMIVVLRGRGSWLHNMFNCVFQLQDTLLYIHVLNRIISITMN